MKKIISMFLFVLGTMQPVLADTPGKMRFNISVGAADNRFYICMPNMSGRYSAKLTTERHKSYEMMSTNIGSLSIANMRNRRLYSQRVPASCNVEVTENKLLTINGHIAISRNKQDEQVYFSKLNCTLQSSTV